MATTNNLQGASSLNPDQSSRHEASPDQAAPSSDPAWLLLAHILRPQGRRGEVLADLFTDFPDRFESQSRVFLAPPGFSGSPSQAKTAQVASFFLPVGRNHGRIVLHFEGITSIEAAEALAGLEVVVPAEERLQPEDDASYISDLLGCSVFDVPPGHPIGTAPDPSTLVGVIEDVHLPTTPDGTRRLNEAAPLLSVLAPTGAEILIPFVQVFVVTLDLPAKQLLMTLPPGLLDLNS